MARSLQKTVVSEAQWIHSSLKVKLCLQTHEVSRDRREVSLLRWMLWCAESQTWQRNCALTLTANLTSYSSLSKYMSENVILISSSSLMPGSARNPLTVCGERAWWMKIGQETRLGYLATRLSVEMLRLWVRSTDVTLANVLLVFIRQCFQSLLLLSVSKLNAIELFQSQLYRIMLHTVIFMYYVSYFEHKE